MEQKYIVITVIVVLFIICLMYSPYDNCMEYERFDTDNMPSAANLDLIVRKAAHEISDMTVDYVVTPCIAGGLHTLNDKIDCIVHYKHYYTQILRDPVSEMFYYLMQLGNDPFKQTLYGDRQREEHRALAIMTDAYSWCLTQVLRYTKQHYNTSGYDPELFKAHLYRLLRSAFGWKMHRVFALNNADAEEKRLIKYTDNDEHQHMVNHIYRELNDDDRINDIIKADKTNDEYVMSYDAAYDIHREMAHAAQTKEEEIVHNNMMQEIAADLMNREMSSDDDYKPFGTYDPTNDAGYGRPVLPGATGRGPGRWSGGVTGQCTGRPVGQPAMQPVGRPTIQPVPQTRYQNQHNHSGEKLLPGVVRPRQTPEQELAPAMTNYVPDLNNDYLFLHCNDIKSGAMNVFVDGKRLGCGSN